MGNGSYQGKVRQYSVPAGDANAIYIGDLVKLAGTAQFINGATFTDIAIAASGDVFVGVVVGFLADTRDSLLYRAASTQRIAIVCDDPNAIFEVQQGNSGTALTANDIGFNVNVTVTAGSTVTGRSASVLDNTTEATTNTLDLKIIGMINRADMDPGTAVGTGALASRFLVRINRHLYVNQIAGV
jgi:hypothetical protein